jgi:hypothetical protein
MTTEMPKGIILLRKTGKRNKSEGQLMKVLVMSSIRRWREDFLSKESSCRSRGCSQIR